MNSRNISNSYQELVISIFQYVNAVASSNRYNAAEIRNIVGVSNKMAWKSKEH
jgi:hypothetical protein